MKVIIVEQRVELRGKKRQSPNKLKSYYSHQHELLPSHHHTCSASVSYRHHPSNHSHQGLESAYEPHCNHSNPYHESAELASGLYNY